MQSGVGISPKRGVPLRIIKLQKRELVLSPPPFELPRYSETGVPLHKPICSPNGDAELFREALLPSTLPEVNLTDTETMPSNLKEPTTDEYIANQMPNSVNVLKDDGATSPTHDLIHAPLRPPRIFQKSADDNPPHIDQKTAVVNLVHTPLRPPRSIQHSAVDNPPHIVQKTAVDNLVHTPLRPPRSIQHSAVDNPPHIVQKTAVDNLVHTPLRPPRSIQQSAIDNPPLIFQKSAVDNQPAIDLEYMVTVGGPSFNAPGNDLPTSKIVKSLPVALKARSEASPRVAYINSIGVSRHISVKVYNDEDVNEDVPYKIWTDSHLRWNASDFGGIKVVRIPANHVWKPDIILYNNADPQYNTAIINTNVIVTAAGEVTWLSHGIFKSSCDINVEYFPFDVQSCQLKFASWTYDGNQVDLTKQYDVGDTTNYQVNGEFDLDDFTAVRNVQYYSCCPEPYPDITFILNLRRRPMFYVFNLILPCVLINGIALLVFYVPPESGEKVTLGISTLLSMTVFLMLIRESLPPTEKTPLIGMYYGVTICIVSFATGLSVVTLNVHHRGMRGTEVPATVRKLILGPLAKVLFVRFEAALPDRGNKGPDKTPSTDMDHIEQYNFSPRFPHRKPSNPEGSGDDFERHFLRVLNKVYQTIERNEIRQAEQDRRDHIRLEWQQVSVVCDRFLLALFVVVTAVATFAILFSSPHGP